MPGYNVKKRERDEDEEDDGAQQPGRSRRVQDDGDAGDDGSGYGPMYEDSRASAADVDADDLDKDRINEIIDTLPNVRGGNELWTRCDIKRRFTCRPWTRTQCAK